MHKEIPSSVLKRAKKLCAISDDPNASTYEIEQALKLAHDILLPYELTVEVVLESLRRDIVTENYLVRGRQRRSKWLDDLMDHIAWFTDSNYMFRTGWIVEYTFVGILSQVQRAIFHAETLHDQIEYYGDCRAPRYMRDIRVYKQGIVDRVYVTMRDLKLDRVPREVVTPMVSTIQSMTPEGSHFMVLAPVKASKIAECRSRFRGAIVDGETYTFDALPKVKAGRTIDVIVDDLVMDDFQIMEDHLVKDLQAAFDLSDKVYVQNRDTSERLPLQAKRPGPPRPPRPSQEAIGGLKGLIQSYIDDHATGRRPSLQGSYAAVSYNPDYAIGYQHGAEIKIGDGVGRRWRAAQ